MRAFGVHSCGSAVRVCCDAVAVLTPIGLADAAAFLADYDEPAPRSLEGVLAGTVNSSYALELANGRRFLRIYEEQDHTGASYEAALLTHLAAGGVATPPPIARRDGRFVGTVGGKPAALFPWCEGQTRCLSRVSPHDTRRVGAALARLHLAGSTAQAKASRFGPDALRVRLARIAGARDTALASLAPALEQALDAWSARRR